MKKGHYTWVRKRIPSAAYTLVHVRRSTWCPCMTVITGGAQSDIRPWQCIPLPFSNDCAHTVFVSSMFTLSVTEANSQPNVVSHYGQVYISQKVCVSGPMFIGLFFLFWWYYHLSTYSTLVFNTLYIIIIIIFIIMSVLANGRSFTANSETKVAILLKRQVLHANSGTKAAVLLGIE